MTIPTRHARRALAVSCAALVALFASVTSADDADIFASKVPPNVMLVVDNSTSMFNVIFHPAYDPDTDYSRSNCDSSDFSGNYTAGPSGSGATFLSGSNISRCGFTRQLPGLDTDHDGVDDDALRYNSNYLYWIFSSAVDATYDIDGDGTPDGTIMSQIWNFTRAFSGCRTTGTYLPYHQDRATAARMILQEVLCQVNRNGKIRFGMTVFRHTGSGPGPNGGFVQIPINDATWDHDADPTTSEVDYSYSLDGSTRTHIEHLYNAFQTFTVDSSTPLGETLFQVYTYFMDRDPNKLPYGDTDKDGTPDTSAGRFPVYQYVTDPNTDYGGRNISEASGLVAPPCPVKEWCQRNFVIMITDGEPWYDDWVVETSGNSGTTAVGFSNFTNLIGNYKDFVGTSTSQCNPWWQCWHLDDIAKFMQEHDFLPDNTDFPGEQNIDIYTLGFATHASLNTFLNDTAVAGGGSFNSSGDPTQLADGIIDALQDIIEKSQVFTAPTVPASRSSDGNNFYLSYFKPADKTAFWEGHLKVFELNAAGEIRDALGNCIFRDPANPATVQCLGGLIQVDQPGFWDAADQMPVPGSRSLYVSKYQTGPPTPLTAPQVFTTTNLSSADLAVTAADIPLYANIGNGTAGITTADELKDAIIRYARGCEFGSGACVERPKTLGDIFHSSPIPVGPPNSAIPNLGYQEFAARYATRTKAIYVGTNDGFLHGFHAGQWQTTPAPAGFDRGTGAELFGFMPYPARQNARHLPNDLPPRDYYYVDGSPSVSDVWFYPSETAVPGGPADWASWHTVLIGGLRQGGETLYALDITNPDSIAGGPGYPSYLWEFPCEDQTSAICTGSGSFTYAEYMGETWSQPVITRVRMTPTCPPGTCPLYVDRWVAIFGAGYDETSDPNEPTGTAYDASLSNLTSRKGRAVFMVDIKTGKVLAMKKFDHNATNGDPAMRFAFASAPAVFDTDSDGYADVVYFGDLGGQLWKWVIELPAEDAISVSGTGSIDQPAWMWKRLFRAEPCIAPACTPARTKSIFYPPTGTVLHGQLYLAFGTGERADLEYIGTAPEERNRYYVIKDVDPLERNTPVVDPDPRYTDHPSTGQVQHVSNYSSACTNPQLPDVGFFFEGEDGEKFITESTIFAGDVLTGSFVPSATPGGCEASGDGYLYFFDLFCGRGKFDDPGDPDPNVTLPRKYVGKGPPTRPTVSMGSLENQGDGNPCDNMVFDFSSDGEGLVLKADCMPNSGVRTRSWRDLD